jgi:L-lactate permease
MISPQSIAVATGLAGAEGKILNATLKFCIVYVIVLGVVAYFMGPIFIKCYFTKIKYTMVLSKK